MSTFGFAFVQIFSSFSKKTLGALDNQGKLRKKISKVQSHINFLGTFLGKGPISILGQIRNLF